MPGSHCLVPGNYLGIVSVTSSAGRFLHNPLAPQKLLHFAELLAQALLWFSFLPRYPSTVISAAGSRMGCWGVGACWVRNVCVGGDTISGSGPRSLCPLHAACERWADYGKVTHAGLTYFTFYALFRVFLSYLSYITFLFCPVIFAL